MIYTYKNGQAVQTNSMPPYNVQYGVIHYANYKASGHKHGVAWKAAIAAMPLATTPEYS